LVDYFSARELVSITKSVRGESDLNLLYEKDFYLWLQEMAIALRARDTKIWTGEDMGASEKRALRSYVKKVYSPST
jgi:hypothetical protein